MLDTATVATVSHLNFVRHSAQNLYGWTTWFIKSNLPLTFCESREARYVILGFTVTGEYDMWIVFSCCKTFAHPGILYTRTLKLVNQSEVVKKKQL